MNFRKRRRRPPRSGWQQLGDFLMALAMLGVVIMIAARMPSSTRSTTDTLQGIVHVADGDSLLLDGVRVRLQGIDAPEIGQTCEADGAVYPCGRQARAALAALIGGSAVACDGFGKDRYGRLLARCHVRATELNRAMVRAGWAVAYGDYEAEEALARKERSGVWRGKFTPPQEWRRSNDGLADVPYDPLADFWRWLRNLFGLQDARSAGERTKDAPAF